MAHRQTGSWYARVEVGAALADADRHAPGTKIPADAAATEVHADAGCQFDGFAKSDGHSLGSLRGWLACFPSSLDRW